MSIYIEEKRMKKYNLNTRFQVVGVHFLPFWVHRVLGAILFIFEIEYMISSCVKKWVSERVLPRAMHIIRSETLGRRLASAKSLAKNLAERFTKILAETLGETFGETLSETFRARQASPQSFESDYMQDSPQDSLRDSFFYAGYCQLIKYARQTLWIEWWIIGLDFLKTILETRRPICEE